MADYITRIRTEDGDKQIDYNALANLPASVTDVTNTVISPNADYAEVGEWADGNPDDEDRLGYFIAVAEVGDNTIKIRKATSADDVRGVTVYNPAFSGNASADKYGADGELLKQYNYVGVMGIVKIIDNGLCAPQGRCMPGDDGTAVPSTNNMGYAVLERVDDTHVLIAVEPGADMIQRIKTDMENMGTGEVPTFDLAALGLADIPLDGTAVKLETDTTEIMAALDAGAVRFHVKLEYNGVVIDMVSTMHDISSPTGGGYICSCAFDPVGGFPLLVNITIEDGSITAMCTALGAGTGEGETVEVPTSIDLSGLDPDENNEGVIVETYTDSSTKETKLTYDESGNIVEIEDADGNVTTLTW